jgi:hypothetical protein
MNEVMLYVLLMSPGLTVGPCQSGKPVSASESAQRQGRKQPVSPQAREIMAKEIKMNLNNVVPWVAL